MTRLYHNNGMSRLVDLGCEMCKLTIFLYSWPKTMKILQHLLNIFNTRICFFLSMEKNNLEHLFIYLFNFH